MKNLKLEELSVEQKIGMLFCARSFAAGNPEDLEFTLDLIRNHALGCIQLPYKNTELMKKVREAADYPIIIVMDMEMGYPGSQLPPIPLMSLSACNTPEAYRAYARAIVTDAKAAGYNSTWGPVIDVLACDGPCSVYRKFSDDPNKVAKAAEYINQVFHNNHFAGCGKHYPGGSHGPVDTHMANVDSPSTKEELINKFMVPYRHLMEKGLLPTIMVGHNVQKDVDPDYPASLSKKTIDIIRDMGFDGVCYTDSLAMMAILQLYGEENVLGMAIAAGNDIVLPNYRSSNRKNYEMLLKNYRDGAFTEERLNEAVRRVLALQEFLGAQPEQPELFTEEDREVYYNIAKDCITAVTDPGVDAALDPDNKDRLFVVLTEANSVDKELAQEAITRNWYQPDAIIEKIHEEFPEAEVVTLTDYATARENEYVLTRATEHKEVVFITFCTTRPYLGTDCLTRRTEAMINAFNYSGKLSAVLHFGNPFALKTLNHIPRKLFGYMMPQSQLHAIEVLAGKLPAKGTLPFQIEFQ